MYFPGQSADQGPPSLRTALATIHRDREWWRKVLIGGLVALTGVGILFVEGYGIESTDNTRQGYPTPLPRWRDWSIKAIQGAFGLIIDFLYFVFPVLFGGLLWGCSAIAVTVFGGAGLLRFVAFGVLGIVLGWLVVMWLLGVSPVAKQFYVNEGIPQDALSRKVFRTVFAAPARGLYLRARLHSAPLYVVSLAILWGASYSQRWGTWLALLLLWLGLSALLYARLITIQLYQAATQQIERRRWEARRTARA